MLQAIKAEAEAQINGAMKWLYVSLRDAAVRIFTHSTLRAMGMTQWQNHTTYLYIFFAIRSLLRPASGALCRYAKSNRVPAFSQHNPT